MSKYTNFDLRKFISEGKETKNESAPGFEHDCAAHVVHETYGYGVCIEGRHTLVENAEGKHEVTHYDVFFKNGDTVENVPVNELKVLTSESHTHGKKKKNEETLDELRPGYAVGDFGPIEDNPIGKAFLTLAKAAKKAGKSVADFVKDIELGKMSDAMREDEMEAEEGQVNELSADAIEAIIGVIGAGGVVGASVVIDKLMDKLKAGTFGERGKAIAKHLEDHGKAAADAIHHRNRYESVQAEVENSKLTKEEAFKKEIKDILDS